MRIGHGYDVHRFVLGRKLVLGGVHIPYEFGLLGHSDADVLIHAICDALLGAAALGDIGKHFPDTNEWYKGIDSRKLLRKTVGLVQDTGHIIENIDTTIITQKPRLAPYITQMRVNIAVDCGVSIDCISVKATTEEGLGFTGEMLGVSVHAVCLLSNK